MNRSVIEMVERMEYLGYLSRKESEVIKRTRQIPEKSREISYEVYEMEKRQKLMLDLWMTLRERKISVEKFLSKICKGRIAVYGGGILGKHLCQE